MNLYEITTELLALEAALEAAEGEVTAEQETLHAFLLDAREDKIDAYVSMIRNTEARAEARKAEAKRIADLAKTDEAKADRLKASLKAHFEATGTTKMNTKRFALSLAKNGGKQAIVVTDEAALPAHFLKQIITTKPDQDALRDALAQGEQIPGVHLAERGTSLRIK